MTQSRRSSCIWYKIHATSLHIAAENGHLQIADQLLSRGTDVNSAYTSSSRKGYTPLHLAVEKGDEKFTKLLLNNGAYTHVTSEIGETPLHIAAENGHLRIVKRLLNHGADVNSVYISSSRKDYTPLLLAVEKGYEEITKLLLNRGALVDPKRDDGETPLHAAVKLKHLQIVLHLLIHGADVNCTYTSSSRKGFTPLHFAAEKGAEEITKLLIKRGAHVDTKNNEGVTPLHFAAKNGNSQIVEQLLNHGADVNSAFTSSSRKGFTPLHIAAKKGAEEIVKLLLNRGADVDAKNNEGVTPLHFAAKNGNSQIVEQLLNHAADVNSAYTNSVMKGCTPLHLAAKVGHEDVVKLLLNHGANVNCLCTHSSKTSYTPLHHAAVARHENVVKLLLVNGARINATPGSLDHKVLEDYQKFVEEIKCMKREKIVCSNISFYDILTGSINKLATYAINENVVQVFKSDDYKTKFPMYAVMLNTCLKKGLERRALLEQSNKLLSSLFHKSFHALPQICTDKILSYLSDKHLRVIVDTFK